MYFLIFIDTQRKLNDFVTLAECADLISFAPFMFARNSNMSLLKMAQNSRPEYCWDDLTLWLCAWVLGIPWVNGVFVLNTQ